MTDENNLLGDVSDPAPTDGAAVSQPEEVTDPTEGAAVSATSAPATSMLSTETPLQVSGSPLSGEAVPSASTTPVSPVTTSATPATAPAGIVVTNTASPTPSTNGATGGLSYDQITDALLASIGDVGTKAHFKLMIYGPPGGTKSSFLGGVDNNLIYDLEDGLIAAKTAHVHSGRHMKQNIKSIPFKSLEPQGKAIVERLANRDPNFEWVEVFSIDTISDLHKRALELITQREHAKRPLSKNLYVPETEDYTEVNEMLTRFVRSLRDLDRNLIILAHAQTVEPKGKPAKTYPDFSEKLANKLEAMMDIVGYMEMIEVEENGEKVYRPAMRVKSEGTIHAKSRIPLPAVILDPTYDQLKAAWEAAVASGNISDQ